MKFNFCFVMAGKLILDFNLTRDVVCVRVSRFGDTHRIDEHSPAKCIETEYDADTKSG
jgi:hypothetical protein